MKAATAKERAKKKLSDLGNANADFEYVESSGNITTPNIFWTNTTVDTTYTSAAEIASRT